MRQSFESEGFLRHRLFGPPPPGSPGASVAVTSEEEMTINRHPIALIAGLIALIAACNRSSLSSGSNQSDAEICAELMNEYDSAYALANVCDPTAANQCQQPVQGPSCLGNCGALVQDPTTRRDRDEDDQPRLRPSGALPVRDTADVHLCASRRGRWDLPGKLRRPSPEQLKNRRDAG